MAWPKGRPRPEGAGRRKGTPNKSTQSLIDKCSDAGLDVFGSMIELAKSGDPDIQITMLKELAGYIYPKRKALEITMADVSDEEIEAEVKRRLDASANPKGL